MSGVCKHADNAHLFDRVCEAAKAGRYRSVSVEIDVEDLRLSKSRRAIPKSFRFGIEQMQGRLQVGVA